MLKVKMLRDIKKNLSQFVTIFLMTLIGIMAYSGISAYMLGMEKAKDNFYGKNNLFDVLLYGVNFSEKDLSKIKSINKVNDAERKMVLNVTSDNNTTLILSVIESNNISKFHVIEGNGFSKDKNGVWLDNFYAKENNLKVGDNITIDAKEYKKTFPIIGLINVPDHLYDVKDSSTIYPDRSNFGFAYISSSAVDKEFLNYNYIMVDMDNYNNKDKEKFTSLSNVLTITKKEDTLSYKTYQGEIDEGKTYIGVFSGIFIFIAILSVITTMNRIVKNERTEIGTLKALGFSNVKILKHYMSYTIIVCILGSILGLVLGYFGIGKLFIGIEMSFFEMPNGKPVMSINSFLVTLIVNLLILFVTYLSTKNILKENAAEALRKKTPVVSKGSIKSTNNKFFNKLNIETRWNIRDVLRNKFRTIMGIVGISASAMLVVCALGMFDSINNFIKLQFEDIYNFKYKISLNPNITSDNLEALEKEYGKNTSQTVQIETLINDVYENNNMVVVDDNNTYLRFLDSSENFMKINRSDGVYITRKLAILNNIKIGDYISFKVSPEKKLYKAKVVGFNKDPQNQNITVTKKYFESLDKEYKPTYLYSNKKVNKNLPGIADVEDKKLLKSSMNDMLSMMKKMIALIILIAAILGIVIIYNLGVLSFSEKEYQFATLKVLGFSNKKIKKIFIKQNNWIAIISIFNGLILGNLLTNWIFKKAISEHYDFSAHINILTYFISSLLIFIVVYVVSKIISRKVSKLDMVISLKGNE